MRRLTAVAALATCALALAGCSTSSEGKPAKTVTATVTKTPALSAAEQRKVCVSTWAELLHENPDASVDDAPADCAKVPKGEQLDAYMEGLQQRNQENRDAASKCLDDPSCTALPVPDAT